MDKKMIYSELLNLPELEVTSVSVTDKSITIDCRIKNEVTKSPCPNCGAMCEKVNQYTHHKVRDLDISGRTVWLNLKVRQFICVPCNRYFQEPLSFVDLGKSHTKRQEKFIFLICQKMNFMEGAAIFNVSPKTIERIVLGECEEISKDPKRFEQVKRIGIDEQSKRKGKGDYMCIITDLDRGIVLDLLPNRKMETIIAYFKSLGEDFCNKITEVSFDNWDAYIGAAKTCFPNAKLVLDRFHITKSLNEGLDNFRKALRKQDKEDKIYKKLKWVLYKPYHVMSDDELDTLDQAFEQSPELKTLFWKREEFHQVLDNCHTVEAADQKLTTWIESLVSEGITAFEGFVKMLSTKKDMVLNYVTNRTSNAVTEGLNNLIRGIRRMSYGMPSFRNLRLRVLGAST
jgi:transposase